MSETDGASDINDRKQKAYALYWPATAALYLASSLVTKRWDKTWIILPAAALASGFFPRVVDKFIHEDEAPGAADAGAAGDVADDGEAVPPDGAPADGAPAASSDAQDVPQDVPEEAPAAGGEDAGNTGE